MNNMQDGMDIKERLIQLKNAAPPTKKGIYVELDSLFDTRLSSLYFLCPQVATILKKSGAYDKRIRDNFGPISADIFYAYYNRRNKLTLQYGLPTPMFDVVRDHFMDMVTDLKQLESRDEIILYVNTYPYELLPVEEEVLREMITEHVGEIEIEFIDMSMTELEPRWILSHVGTMFLYNAYNWLEYHSSTTEIYRQPLLNVMCFGPAIITGDNKGERIDVEYFKKLQETLAFVIDYNFMDVKMFSAVDYYVGEEDKPTE